MKLRPRIDTDGRRKLAAWAKETGGSATSIARALGFSQPSASAWLLGNARPEEKHRALIEVLTDGAVKADDWTTEAERVDLRKRLRRVERTGTGG